LNAIAPVTLLAATDLPGSANALSSSGPTPAATKTQPMRFKDSRSFSQHPRDPAFFNDPYPAYREMRMGGELFFWEDYGFWCCAGHKQLSALLRDRRFGRQILHVASREQLGWPERPAHLAPFDAIERHSLLELEPPEHTRLRALVNRAFVSRHVERLAPSIAALANGLVDGFERRGAVDLIEAFATPIPVRVIAELIGAPTNDSALLLDWSHKMVAMYQFEPTRAAEDAAARASLDFSAYVRGLMAESRRRPRDDLISQLIAAETNEGRLSEDELVTTVVLLLNAGHEATVHAIGNSVNMILKHGLTARFAGAGERDLAVMIDELLRFDPPLHLFTRYALEDLEIDGVALRKGERIGLLLGAANRDPLVFAEPDRLNLARAPNPHVAFGAGIHFCVGAPLARLELNIALPILCRRLPALAFAETPRYRDAYHFHGLEALKVVW
jgi:cytochrome P450